MWQVISLILGVGLVAIFLPGCGLAKGSNPAAPGEVVAVQRGDITTYITATGNLAFSHTEDLCFHLGGTVAEVGVEEGDNVTQGQVLARLDTTALELAVDTAELAVDTSELAVRSAEVELKTIEGNIRNAKIDLEQTTDNFRKITYPYTYSTFVFDVPQALQFITTAQRKTGEAQAALQGGLSDDQQYQVSRRLKEAQDNLMDAQQLLARGTGQDVFAAGVLAVKDFWTLRTTQLAVEKAQSTLENTKTAYEKATVALDKSKKERDRAKKELKKAKDELGKALICAPFDAVVTKVSTNGGDEVKIGELAISLAEPNKFEADVLVNEVDIPWVKVGGKTALQVDAVPGISLAARVAQIAPTATVQQGVVNYKVTIEVVSLEAMPALQLEPGRGTRPTSTSRASGSSRSMSFELRQGLSVTTNILKEEKRDVLLVPSRAIIRQSGNTFVQVMKDGVSEQRAVKIGLSDYQNSEVTEGLSDGENIVLQAKPTATPTSPGGTRPAFGVPRPGGMPR